MTGPIYQAGHDSREENELLHDMAAHALASVYSLLKYGVYMGRVCALAYVRIQRAFTVYTVCFQLLARIYAIIYK